METKVILAANTDTDLRIIWWNQYVHMSSNVLSVPFKILKHIVDVLMDSMWVAVK